MRLTDLIPAIRDRKRTLQIAVDGVLEEQPFRQAMPTTSLIPMSDVNTLPDGDDGTLAILCPKVTAEDRARDSHLKKGTRLARQEGWEDIAHLIAEADRVRAKTGGGMPVAELVAYGARADVVSSAEHALLHGAPDCEAAVLDGIEALESVLAEFENCPWTAAVVALAHMDLAWAWRGTDWLQDLPERNRNAFAAHFDRANDVLAPIDPHRCNSPFLASAHAMLSSGKQRDARRLTRSFEDLIDLDPHNARAMRHFGTQMLPRWHGDYEALELAARRNAGRTYDVWGNGGYTWVMFDAIATDPEACARLDHDFFVEGLQDILQFSHDQYVVNLLASYCANTMQNGTTGHPEADVMRARIGENAEWIARSHLREVHPLLWAHAARGFDNALRVSCPRRFAEAGLADARHYLAEIFQRDSEAGQTVIFTEGEVTAEAY